MKAPFKTFLPALALTLTLISPANAVAAPQAPKPSLKLSAAASAVTPGAVVNLIGKAANAGPRKVLLQQAVPGSGWQQVASARIKPTGKFAFRVLAPLQAGTAVYRAYAPKVGSGTRKQAVVASRALSLSVKAPTTSPKPTVPASPTPPPAAPVPDGTRANPYRAQTSFTFRGWEMYFLPTDLDRPKDADMGPAREGWNDVATLVSFKNVGPSPSDPYKSLEIRFIGSDSGTYGPATFNESGTDQACISRRRYSGIGIVYPSGSGAGEVCAVVPEPAATGGVWEIQQFPVVAGTPKIYVSIF